MTESTECKHRIADMRNEKIVSGYMCVDCGKLFSAAHEGAPAKPQPAIAPPFDETDLDQALTERDEYHDIADQLTEQIAAITGVDVGEHTSANDPWQAALIAADEFLAKAFLPSMRAAYDVAKVTQPAIAPELTPDESDTELDALRADAARYKFIRVNGVYHLQFERGECGTGVYLGAAADQAIDAAMKEAKNAD